jgi:hypothetical protein
MTTLNSIAKSNLVFLAGLLLLVGSPAWAVRNYSGDPDVIVVPPADLPAAAQIAGQAMYLSSPGFTHYLYIEQNDGQRLAVLDVSDPAHTGAVAEVELGAPRFEFVRNLDDKTVLVRFTGSRAPARFGLIDLRRAKAPVLRTIAGIPQSDAAAVLDGATLLFTDSRLPITGQPRQYTYEVVATKHNNSPAIATIDNIRQEITDEETGRRFLLSANGLWIVRQPHVEKQHELNEIARQQP